MRLPLKVPEWWRWFGSRGSKTLMTFLAPADGTDGEAAADDLAHRRQVGADAEDLLVAEPVLSLRVITSSQMRSAPCSSARRRAAAK